MNTPLPCVSKRHVLNPFHAHEGDWEVVFQDGIDTIRLFTTAKGAAPFEVGEYYAVSIEEIAVTPEVPTETPKAKKTKAAEPTPEVPVDGNPETPNQDEAQQAGQQENAPVGEEQAGS